MSKGKKKQNTTTTKDNQKRNKFPPNATKQKSDRFKKSKTKYSEKKMSKWKGGKQSADDDQSDVEIVTSPAETTQVEPQ